MKKLIDPILTLGQNLFDLVFPVTCLGCGKEGAYLCPGCLVRLPREQKQVCIRCRQPSPFGKTHPNCQSKNFADGLISCLPYQDPLVKKLIEIFKYRFISSLDGQLAGLIEEEIGYQNLSGLFSGFTILPVPLHQKRLRWRGFNQAELLVRKLRRSLNAVCDCGLLIRHRFTKPQVKLNAAERSENIRNAFSVKDEHAVSGRNYLIVDDVVTSGSTINEIARTLKRHGAAQVWAATVARD